MAVLIENVDNSAHTGDLVCLNQSCGFSVEGVDLLTHAQVFFVEAHPEITLKGNIAGTVPTYADLPSLEGITVGTVYHVASDENGDNLGEQFAPDLYLAEERESVKVWTKLYASINVVCLECNTATAHPMFDPRNAYGCELGRAKIS